MPSGSSESVIGDTIKGTKLRKRTADLESAMKKKNNRAPQWLICGFVMTSLAAGGLLLRTMQASPRGTSRRTEPQWRIKLGTGDPRSLYAVTIAIKNPEQIQGKRQVRVAIADGRGKIAEKLLHSADLDFYLTLRPRVPGEVSVALSAPGAEPLPELATIMRRIPTEPGDPSVIAALLTTHGRPLNQSSSDT